jgi:hypothetical protein
MWYSTLGLFDRSDIDTSDEEHRLLPPETMTRMTPYGEVFRLAPPVDFSETPGHWEDPILTVRGSCKPEWVSRPKGGKPTRGGSEIPKAARRDERRQPAPQRQPAGASD